MKSLLRTLEFKIFRQARGWKNWATKLEKPFSSDATQIFQPAYWRVLHNRDDNLNINS